MKYLIVEVSRTLTTVMPLNDAKRDLDVTFDDDDTMIQQQVDEAVNYIETYCNLYLQPVVLDLVADRLPSPLHLPRGPVSAAPTSVTVDGVAVAGFRGLGGSPYAVLPAAGASWPQTATGMGGVVVRFTAGYPEGAVPAGLRSAIRAILAIHYDKPTGQELKAQWDAVHRILSPYKLRSI
jgi:hypothetical protein